MASGPFYREAGAGPGVVCLHSNASTSGQWRALMELLAPTYRVLAADSYGAGKSPAWPANRQLVLRDEVALLEPVFTLAGAPFALVGHSYGAAIALIAALAHPGRVRALALYEPTLFSLVDAGNPDLAAEHFIDYWMGQGSWARTPEARKPPIAASIANIRGWAHCLVNERTPLAAFRKLDIPFLYLTGGDSPAASLGVARLLTRTLPRVEVVQFKGMGHMGPITHAGEVNTAIAAFLARA